MVTSFFPLFPTQRGAIVRYAAVRCGVYMEKVLVIGINMGVIDIFIAQTGGSASGGGVLVR